MINLTFFQKSMIVGILLSDGNIEKRKGWNPRIRIEHSFKNFNYIWFVFNELSTLINTFPLLIKRKFKSKYFYSLAFRTRQLSCLNEMYDLFYDTNKKEKVSGAYAIKLIKYEIFYYINYISLAFWIMGDGSKAPSCSLLRRAEISRHHQAVRASTSCNHSGDHWRQVPYSRDNIRVRNKP